MEYNRRWWAGLCVSRDTEWPDAVPNVACRQLGYPGGAAYYTTAGGASYETAAYLTADVDCPEGGNETALEECGPLVLSGVPDGCEEDDEGGSDRFLVRVVCLGKLTFQAAGREEAWRSGGCARTAQHLAMANARPLLAGAVEVEELQLAGGSLSTEGRVEVLSSNGTWGTVCSGPGEDDQQRLADVVCRQLGLPGPALYRGAAFFGDGGLEAALDVKECTGDEARLEDCTVAAAGDPHSCRAPAFGVACTGGWVGGCGSWR